MSTNDCNVGTLGLSRFWIPVLVILLTLSESRGAAPGDFPSRPVRIFAPDAGGSGDTTARIIANGLTRALGQQIIVENRAGSGVIAGQAVATAKPDGYTVLLFGSTIWLLPFLQEHVPFDPVKDLASLTLASRTPLVLVVNPALPVKSVRELIALANTRPGDLSYGAAIIGGANHLAPELFKSMARVNIVHIAYKGVAPALTDLVSGRLQVMFPAASSGMPFVKAGRLRALAVTTAQESALAPGLPTVAAAGLPGYEASYISAAQVPAHTPPAVITRLNQEFVRVLNEPDVKEKLFGIGTESVGSSPEELTETMKREVAKWGKLIKEAGIRSY